MTDPTSGAGRRNAVFVVCGLALLFVVALAGVSVGLAPEADRAAVLSKFLEWPILGFVLLMVIFCVLGQELVKILSTSNLKIAGLVEIEKQVGEAASTAEISAEEVAALEARVAALEAMGLENGKPVMEPAASADADADADPMGDMEPNAPAGERELYDALIFGLENSDYTWRSLERLGYGAGITDPKKVAHLLRTYGKDEVQMSKGKSGNVIARLI